MSEEILKALMQLFAIISKQDDGTSLEERKYVLDFLRSQLQESDVEEYIALFDKFSGLDKAKKKKKEEVEEDEGKEKKRKLTSVKDSVRILGICKKVNKTLTQKQKVVVLVRLYEMLKAENNFTAQRLQIIETAGDVFNLEKAEIQAIEVFIKEQEVDKFDSSNVLIINEEETSRGNYKHIHSTSLSGNIFILHIESVDLYFLKYTSSDEVTLNGLLVQNNRVYLFANGAKVKTPTGKPIYYSDVVSKFLAGGADFQLSFNAENITFTFPNGGIGINELTISEGAGRLVGIMGASGAGKTTLMNVLSGIEEPTTGAVKINKFDINTDKEEVDGVIGYVPQDDLLIEELTVYQNLFFNAKLCLKDLSDEEIDGLVTKVLKNLGLEKTRNLKVGSPLKKTISGGQRKRLNIGLELIREPSVLFVDEPTSGLSSRDSENVMELLNEMTLRGKLIFVVIHQPSSAIYKMFDKMIILDTGGYLIYYGNPIEAISYFKEIDNQANLEVGEYVNPELIFNIIESQVVDEFGNYTGKRKILPEQWAELYQKNFELEKVEDINEQPPGILKRPNFFKQLQIFFKRDLLSKISNKQYVLLNLLEAPLLAFFLSFIIRYIEDPNSNTYIFRENDNIPAYIIMTIVVALFIGLTVSAEEIFRDQKILKREKFLNLSRGSYLLSKVILLFSLSAIQSILLVVVGNSILGIQGMYFSYWIVLFSVFCFANLLGLNISATFNSAVTIYILIPLLIIPQMILGGAIFSYEKLNRLVGGGYQVPFIAEVMASRWAYEGLTVNQFVNNKYQKPLYEVERRESHYDFKISYLIPLLKRLNKECKEALPVNSDSAQKLVQYNFKVLRNEIERELKANDKASFVMKSELTLDNYDLVTAVSVDNFLDNLDAFYNEKFNNLIKKKDLYITSLQKTKDQVEKFRELKDDYYNENLAFYLKNRFARNKAFVVDGKVLQVVDPIYKIPNEESAFQLSYPFYSPYKYFFHKKVDTLTFNVTIIWLMSILLYVFLYFDVFRRIMNGIGKIKLNQK